MEVTARSVTNTPRSVTILGSTGSVGCSTIDLIERNPGDYVVEALTAWRNSDLLIDQAQRLRPQYVAIGDTSQYKAVKDALSGTSIEVGCGVNGITDAAARPSDMVIAAIVGAAGLAPTMEAVNRGAMVGLANKECLVCAGDLMLQAIGRNGAVLLPVDSEHNAIFQVFDFDQRKSVDHLILTASGGPFRTFTTADMRNVTPAQAVAHPNWDMGAKISVDSATMMNKGLEIIEAHYLFGMAEDEIKVLVHPESVVHSLVAYVDGSVLAQLGTPDMRTPIAYTLAWPKRMDATLAPLDLVSLSKLTFEAPDPERFPSLRLAREALLAGGNAPTTLNAANEIAVEGFLGGRIGFLDIANIVEETLNKIPSQPMSSLDEVVEFDGAARQEARSILSAASN
ncbi:MAG: 1-deoxy-D-xylulose-5-phosphate reductoisomerase [Rhodospirillaceae bacterium]|jgi:1-deoxy-D-xylulose-5-phosphate reductoisomerase|nr:1-deoxy-D-xylulose-5-phosphate reductoisomerase [Rhodospirillaceae bacterium]